MGLGFGMNIWKALHFTFALALPLTLLFLLSCKQAHETHAGLGPEVSADSLNMILNRIATAAGDNVTNLQKGQMLHYQESLRANNQDPDVLESEDIFTVIDRTKDVETGTTRITDHHTSRTLSNDGTSWNTLESEDTIEVPMPTSSASGLLASFGGRMATTPDTSQQPVRITYHNLRTSEGDVDVPDTAKARANCANVPNCKIHVTFLSYDEALWSDDSHYVKRSYDLELTSQLPFIGTRLFGIMTLGCIGMFQNIKGNNYYLRDCQYLSDLQM
jgi:hypothetical protein